MLFKKIFFLLHIHAVPQLGQLEVAIREHKQEMARKVESLQQSLETRESELRDAQRKLSDRNTKVRCSHRIRGHNM